jgi:hypothetical protein
MGFDNIFVVLIVFFEGFVGNSFLFLHVEKFLIVLKLLDDGLLALVADAFLILFSFDQVCHIGKHSPER